MHNLRRYDYALPRELIAKKPAVPRDASRLFVYHAKDTRVYHDIFKNLDRYLPKNALLICNDTKVLPARITVKKSTGGNVFLLYLKKSGPRMFVLASKPLRIGEILTRPDGVRFRIQAKKGSVYTLTLTSKHDILHLLARYGRVPLPPYLKDSPLQERERKIHYQTIFARRPGAVAAPTASLHFTKQLLHRLKKCGIDIWYITLHVGLGTFAPINEKNLTSHTLHEENYSIPASTWRAIRKAKKENRSVIAVGTTVVRALESAARTQRTSGYTNLFIQDRFRFRIIDGLVTNFHVPRSSLLMLVSGLVGTRTLMRLYRVAIQKKYRFFSFGDGMLILRA